MHGPIRSSREDTEGIMGVEVEDIEADKRLQQSREKGRLSHTDTHSMCVPGCLW